jgi:hypothetical protein
LVLGTKRRLMAAVATVTVAAMLAVASSGRGCAVGDGTPAGAARAGDKRATWELLGPRTRARVVATAQAATEKVGGARRYGPLDVLDVTAREQSYEPTDVVTRTENGDAAVVDVLGPAGRRDELELVKVDGRWRVELTF